MLAFALPSLPPPISSLLPTNHDIPNTENIAHTGNSIQAQAAQQQQRLRKPQNTHPRSALAILAFEERQLAARKYAIATYGYSWLKPAGCTKTMLGRQEEEMEKEEVERQLREVEMQEANQREMEEADRMARLEQQRQQEERGNIVGGEERDLDDDVPDADADAEEDEDVDDEVEMEMGGDLDDEVPEAEEEWNYDTTRELDSDVVDATPAVMRSQQQARAQTQHSRPHLQHQPTASTIIMSGFDDDDDEPLGPDLDEAIPDMDVADLDDDIPEGEAEEDGAWEHTDTSLEESDMDISILPPGVTAAHPLSRPTTTMLPPYLAVPSSSQSAGSARRQQVRHHPPRDSFMTNTSQSSSAIRSVSGNIPSRAPRINARPSTRTARSFPPQLHFTPDQFGSDFSVSHLISTDGTSHLASSAAAAAVNPNDRQRAWLDPSSARRNLFGTSTTNTNTNANVNTNAVLRNAAATSHMGALQSGQARNARPVQQVNIRVVSGHSSGGLFTPDGPSDGGNTTQEPSWSRTRSGRVVSGSSAGRQRRGG